MKKQNEFEKSKTTLMKAVGATLIWLGIACLGYVLTNPENQLIVIISFIGFISFVMGLIIFSSSFKNEIIQKISSQSKKD